MRKALAVLAIASSFLAVPAVAECSSEHGTYDCVFGAGEMHIAWPTTKGAPIPRFYFSVRVLSRTDEDGNQSYDHVNASMETKGFAVPWDFNARVPSEYWDLIEEHLKEPEVAYCLEDVANILAQRRERYDWEERRNKQPWLIFENQGYGVDLVAYRRWPYADDHRQTFDSDTEIVCSYTAPVPVGDEGEQQ